MSDPRTPQEALAKLKGIPPEVFRREAAHKEKIRARGETFMLLPPAHWPQLYFNWDLSQAAQHYVYDGVEPEDFARCHPDGLALGYVDLAEFDTQLCHFSRRQDIDELWKCGDARKLCHALAHLEAGLPITPPLVSVADGQLCFAGGNHRYTAAKFSGETRVPIYVEFENVRAVESLVQVAWVDI